MTGDDVHEQDESLIVDSLGKTFGCSHDALRISGNS